MLCIEMSSRKNEILIKNCNHSKYCICMLIKLYDETNCEKRIIKYISINFQ